MRILLLALCVACSACALSQDDWRSLVEASRACEPQDTCVNFHDPCLCTVPVNQKEAANLAAQKQRVVCQSMADCLQPAVNLRCEAGRCIGDRPDGG